MPWYVLYTKSRNEKKVAQELKRREIEVYCPTRKVNRKWSDRIKVVEEPFFKSYCFVRLEENERSRVFGIPGFVAYVFWLKKPAIVKDEEIEVIKDLLNDFDHETITIENYSVNDQVMLQSGLFMNQQGTIKEIKGNSLVVKLPSVKLAVVVDLRKNKVSKYPTP